MAKKKLFQRRQGLYGTEKVPIKFEIDMLNTLLAYILEDPKNKLVSRGCLVNVKKLFDLMDMRLYNDDIYLEARIHYIRQALIAKLEIFMDNKNLILDYCACKKYAQLADEIKYDIDTINLSGPEIKYITSMVSDRLNYCFLYLYKDKLKDEFDKLETNEFIHLKDLKTRIMDMIQLLIADIRRAESLESANMDFSLEPEMFEAIVHKTVEELQNPSNNLKCGIQALNEMIGGAFESKRFYMFLG